MRVGALVALAVLAGCASPAVRMRHSPITFGARTGLDISPLPHAPYAGTSIPLHVTGEGGDRSSGVMWTTEPLRRAWVTSDGVAHLFEPGRVRVIARAGDRLASTELEIRPNPVSDVFAERAYRGPVFPGDSVRIRARAYDDDGTLIDDVATAFAIDVRGEERGGGGAGITPEGVFVADRPGLYTVLVEVNSRAATVPILVRPSARPDPHLRAGSDTATLDSIALNAPRLAPVIVRPARTRRVHIESTDYTAYTGTSMRLEASVWLEGAREPDTAAIVQWSSSDTSIAIVDADGFVSFRRHGWVRLSARHDGAEHSRRLLVRRNPAAHMVLQSNARYPRVGQPVELTEEAWAYGAMKIPHARAYFGIVSHGAGRPRASGSR